MTDQTSTAIVPSGDNEPAAPLCTAGHACCTYRGSGSHDHFLDPEECNYCGADQPVMRRDCMRESQDDVAADGFSDPDQYAHDLGLVVDDEMDGNPPW